MESPPRKSDPFGGGVLSTPDYDVGKKSEQEKSAKKQNTDFHKINKELDQDRRPVFQRRTITDNLIDALTPLMIFFMVLSVTWYLIDVRSIFENEHVAMRWVSFFLVMGVTALNRLVNTTETKDHIIYVTSLFMVTAVFSVGSSPMVDGVVTSFFGTVITNLVVVGFLWWITNTLMHECCLDENETAGDIGILTGTLKKIQKSIKADPNIPKQDVTPSIRPKGHLLEPATTIDAIDPHDFKGPEKKAAPKTYIPATKRLTKRHPGISIFYFAAFTFLIFALGLPVLRQGGEFFVLRGHLYVGIYTTASLTLLMLTALSGLRQYFRSRNVTFPRTIGIFWLSLGSVMIIAVLLGAIAPPMPTLPGMFHVDQRAADVYSQNSASDIQAGPITTAAQAAESSQILQQLGTIVIICFLLLILFAAFRTVGLFAASVGRNRDYYPQFIIDFFNKLDAFFIKYMRLPKLPKPKRLLHIKKGMAQSNQFHSQLSGQGSAEAEQTRQYLAHAYDALCALAYDLGAPKNDDQTPYEFIESFPEELKAIKKEARILTDLYVQAAYSEQPLQKNTLDQLRHFWFAYDKLKARYIR